MKKTNCQIKSNCPFCEAESPYISDNGVLSGRVSRTQGVLLRDPDKTLFGSIQQALAEGKQLYLRVVKKRSE